MSEAILIAAAVCADLFAAALAYGVKRIRIGAAGCGIIVFIGALFLGVSLFASTLVKSLAGTALCAQLSAAMLILIAMKNLSSACMDDPSPLPPDGEPLGFVSAVVTGLALSADSLAVGFGAGVTMSVNDKLLAVLISLVLGALCIAAGLFLGRKLCKTMSRYRTALVSSAVLFVLAVMKLT